MRVNWHVLLLIAVVGVSSFAFGSSLFSTTHVITASSSEGTGNTISYHSQVCKTITREDGTMEDLGCNHNLFNQDGMNLTRDLLSFFSGGGSGYTLVNVIAIANKTGGGSPSCNTAQDSANQILCGEYVHSGLARAAADATRLNETASGTTAGNWTITKQFTNTGAGALDVNATGLFNSTTINDTREVFFAQNTFTTATLQVNDKLNVTWFIWVT